MKNKFIAWIKSLVKRFNGEVPISVLKKRGLKVGDGFTRQSGCFIDPSFAWLITIGDNVTFSLKVTVLAHDASTAKIMDYTKIGAVTIEDDCFIGANVLILPGVTIGKGSIVGSGSVVTKDIPAGSVAAGNPAKVISTVDEYSAKMKKIFETGAPFSKEYTVNGKIDNAKKEEMISYLKENRIAFVK